MNTVATAARQSAVEVKKHSLRQSRDGLVVSFVVHPNDIPDTLLTAPIGQRYVLALVAMNDDETPITDPVKPDKSAMSKAAYQMKSDGEQAVVRSALLARDPQFQVWCNRPSEKEAADYIREHCGVHSRKEIGEGGPALDWFLTMELEFRQAVGREPHP